jgi:hypothetical protein
MTQCCNDNGNCDQGRNCPIRKQRIKEVNDAYANGFKDAMLDDPMGEAFATFRELITLLIAMATIGLIAYVMWGK